MLNNKDEYEFEKWAKKRGLSITKHPWHSDVYESEATQYAYMGWEARQKEIDTLKTKLEEFVLCVGGTEKTSGLIELIDAYFYGSGVHKKAEKLVEETRPWISEYRSLVYF